MRPTSAMPPSVARDSSRSRTGPHSTRRPCAARNGARGAPGARRPRTATGAAGAPPGRAPPDGAPSPRPLPPRAPRSATPPGDPRGPPLRPVDDHEQRDHPEHGVDQQRAIVEQEVGGIAAHLPAVELVEVAEDAVEDERQGDRDMAGVVPERLLYRP